MSNALDEIRELIRMFDAGVMTREEYERSVAGEAAVDSTADERATPDES